MSPKVLCGARDVSARALYAMMAFSLSSDSNAGKSAAVIVMSSSSETKPSEPGDIFSLKMRTAADMRARSIALRTCRTHVPRTQ